MLQRLRPQAYAAYLASQPYLDWRKSAAWGAVPAECPLCLELQTDASLLMYQREQGLQVPSKCEYCHTKYVRAEISAHKVACSAKSVECPLCHRIKTVATLDGFNPGGTPAEVQSVANEVSVQACAR